MQDTDAEIVQLTDQPLDTEHRTIRQLWQVLRPELEKLSEGLDYFSLSPDLKYGEFAGRPDQPIGKTRWIAVYAVTGGSEGHYVHVDRIFAETEYCKAFTHEPLFLAKTFGGWDDAVKIASYLGCRLGA